MGGESPVGRYRAADVAYRKLVSDYRVAVRHALNFLSAVSCDWGKLWGLAEPRHGRPPTDTRNEDPDADVMAFACPWRPERLIGPDRFRELFAALGASWDALNDAFRQVGEPERESLPTPADVHAAATAYTPFTLLD